MSAKECEKILADGVFEHHFGKVSMNKDTDYKEYIKTQQFKDDFKNDKFHLGLGVEIEGVPIKLDYGSDDTDIHNFVEKVEKSVDFKMSSEFYQVYQYSVANVDLAKAYNDCLKKHEMGFDIDYDTTGISITFKVSYSNFGNLPNPVFNEVFITPASKMRAQSIKKGEEFDNNSSEIFTFDLDKDTKEVIFTIDTNLTAQSLKVSLGKKGLGNGSLPIGTIISSFLTWEEFQKTTENNKDSGGIWKSEFSYWSPCDGRAVPKSEFQAITSQTNVPELRGLFLRGLNTFDFFGENEGKISKIPTGHEDSENRIRGNFQEDKVKNHFHNHNRAHGPDLVAPSGGGAGVIHSGYDIRSDTDVQSDGGTETRPKNAAIFYYIRIN